MTTSVLVIGAGIAGLAAAWSATHADKVVTIVHAGVGATALGSGAVDSAPWEQILRAARGRSERLTLEALPSDVVQFSEQLGIWSIPAPPDPMPLLATTAGRLRPARGHDRALLNIANFRNALVILPRVPRAGWDADSLATALSADPIAHERNLRFEAVDVPVLRYASEDRIADGDLAARHDDASRTQWLSERLLEACKRLEGQDRRPSAVLMGSWLGANIARANDLSDRVGIPVGEALVGVGSSAGLRFEAARERFLLALGVTIVRDKAKSIEFDDETVTVRMAREVDALVADGLVLAVGGIASGGIIYLPPEHAVGDDLPRRARPPFALSIDARIDLALGGKRLGIVSSMHGPELDMSAWPRGLALSALEAIGVSPDGVRVAPRVTVAGDLIADRPRTLLEGVVSGIRAGREI